MRKPLRERFNEKWNLDKKSGCWVWSAAINSDGYGRFLIDGRNAKATHVSWGLFRKKDRGNLFVLHKCDTPACVNPKHLFLGTYKDNALDNISKGRNANQKKKMCPRGHEYSGRRPDSGKRFCKTCVNAKTLLSRKLRERGFISDFYKKKYSKFLSDRRSG